MWEYVAVRTSCWLRETVNKQLKSKQGWKPTEELRLHRSCGLCDVLRIAKLERAVGDGLLQVSVVSLELRLRSEEHMSELQSQ